MGIGAVGTPSSETRGGWQSARCDIFGRRLRLFLSGGAGVRKSTVTNALFEAFIRFLNSVAGENPDDVKAAPTGKAAFNIKCNNTLYAAFKIPANRGFDGCVLDSDKLNTIRAKLKTIILWLEVACSTF